MEKKTNIVAEEETVDQRLVPNPYATYVAETVVEWAENHGLKVDKISLGNYYDDLNHSHMQFYISADEDAIHCSEFAIRVPVIHRESENDSFKDLAVTADKAVFTPLDFSVDLTVLKRTAGDEKLNKSAYVKSLFDKAFYELPSAYNDLILSLNGKYKTY